MCLSPFVGDTCQYRIDFEYGTPHYQVVILSIFSCLLGIALVLLIFILLKIRDDKRKQYELLTGVNKDEWKRNWYDYIVSFLITITIIHKFNNGFWLTNSCLNSRSESLSKLISHLSLVMFHNFIPIQLIRGHWCSIIWEILIWIHFLPSILELSNILCLWCQCNRHLIFILFRQLLCLYFLSLLRFLLIKSQSCLSILLSLQCLLQHSTGILPLSKFKSHFLLHSFHFETRI